MYFGLQNFPIIEHLCAGNFWTFDACHYIILLWFDFIWKSVFNVWLQGDLTGHTTFVVLHI